MFTFSCTLCSCVFMRVVIYILDIYCHISFVVSKIYLGSDTSARRQWTLCGKDTKRIFFEWVGDFITFKFYADFRRNESWVPPVTTTKPTTAAETTSPCIDPASLTGTMTFYHLISMSMMKISLYKI